MSAGLRDAVIIEPGSFTLKASLADHQRVPDVASRTRSRIHDRGGEKRTQVARGKVHKDVEMDAHEDADVDADEEEEDEDAQQGDVNVVPSATHREWAERAAEWEEVLVQSLHIRRGRNDHPLLVAAPLDWTPADLECLAQMAFERLNVPGLYVTSQPLLVLYGMGQVSGLVVDIGHSCTKATSVFESVVYPHLSHSVPVGGADVEVYLDRLLRKDAHFMAEWGSETPLTMDDVRAIKESGKCSFKQHPEVVQPDLQKRVDCEITRKSGQVKKFTLGNARFDCLDVLFNPSLIGKTSQSIAQVISNVVSQVEPERRTSLWESLTMTGGGATFAGLNLRLEFELAPFLAASETSSELQAKEAKFRHIPEYFTFYKARPQDAAFLGAIIVSKLIFQDSKNYITKSDYTTHGPSIIHTKL